MKNLKRNGVGGKEDHNCPLAPAHQLACSNPAMPLPLCAATPLTVASSNVG